MSHRVGVRVNSGVRRGALSAWERDELHATIRYWVGRGMTDADVAIHSGCASRTVQRYRYARGIPAFQVQKKHERKWS